MKPFESTLKRAGYSITKVRRQVFKALQGQDPMTMHELVDYCGKIDRASVYRTVALFEKLGIVERLQNGWKYRLELSDPFLEHHHHATCLQCGVSIDIPEDTRLEVRMYELADIIDFRLERHQLELHGYCKRCSRALPL